MAKSYRVLWRWKPEMPLALLTALLKLPFEVAENVTSRPTRDCSSVSSTAGRGTRRTLPLFVYFARLQAGSQTFNQKVLRLARWIRNSIARSPRAGGGRHRALVT